jgi:predicted permease
LFVSFHVDRLWQDLRQALRGLVKTPSLSAVIVLTIGLGVGANAAMFSVLNSFMLRPLPVRDPGSLVVLANVHEGNEQPHTISYADYLDYRGSPAFADSTAYIFSFLGLGTEAWADRISACFVSSSYFSMLGIAPAEGRLIRSGEGDTPGRDPVIVLGHSYWKRRFGGDPGVVGRTVRVNGRALTVIGVVPEAFHGTFSVAEFDAYLPLGMVGIDPTESPDILTKRDDHSLTVLAHLAPGVSRARAEAAMDAIARGLEEQYPDTNKTVRPRVIPEHLARPSSDSAEQLPLVSSVFMAMVGLVLLVACVNVVNLLLAKATGRRRELALRAALGAGRGRLVRQLVTESMVLAIAGGAAGLVVGGVTSSILASIRLPGDLPFRFDFSFDWRVYGYVMVLSALAGVFVGLLPGLRAARVDLNDVLREGGRSQAQGGRQGLRKALVVAQVAISLVLLVAAGLFVRSLGRAQRVDLGFDPHGVLNVSMDVAEQGYDEPRGRTFYREVESRVAALPGVASAGFALSAPLGMFNTTSYFTIEGQALDPKARRPFSGYNLIEPAYFDTMQIRVRSGRRFTTHDDQHSVPVAIINKSMADRFWPNQNPIGRRFKADDLGRDWLEVVGVVDDGKFEWIFDDPKPYFFAPLEQHYRSLHLLQARTTVAPASLAPAVEREIRALDPNLPVYDVMTMDDVMGGGNGFFLMRIGAAFAAALGLMGLVLATVGVYGVVSYAASQRTQEIGIRVALGAKPRDVARLVIGQGFVPVVMGLAAGLASAAVLGRLIANLLFGISPTDPLTFVSVPLVLLAVAMIACYLPARRATRVDPIVALRQD